MAAKMVAAKERKRTTSVVLQTYGMLKIDPELLQRILDEEPGSWKPSSLTGHCRAGSQPRHYGPSQRR